MSAPRIRDADVPWSPAGQTPSIEGDFQVAHADFSGTSGSHECVNRASLPAGRPVAVAQRGGGAAAARAVTRSASLCRAAPPCAVRPQAACESR